MSKAKYLIIILTVTAGITFGQSKNPAFHCEKTLDTTMNREVYSVVDIPPGVNGGMNKLFSELGAIEIPKDPDVDQIRIKVSFIVEPTGSITGLRTNEKVKSTILETKLLQFFGKYNWNPGSCNGVKVPTMLVIVIKS